jgi:hypothetical protein
VSGDLESVFKLLKSFEENQEIDADVFVKQILKNRIKPKVIRKLEQEYRESKQTGDTVIMY